MKKRITALCHAPSFQKCVVETIFGEETQRLRLFDLGFFQGSEVIPLYECHGGGTKVYAVKNTLIAVREKEADIIMVREVEGNGSEKE